MPERQERILVSYTEGLRVNFDTPEDTPLRAKLDYVHSILSYCGLPSCDEDILEAAEDIYHGHFMEHPNHSTQEEMHELASWVLQKRVRLPSFKCGDREFFVESEMAF